MQKLIESDFEACAKELGCEVAAIKAVVEVEAAGEGFLSDDRPKILFEAHWFSKFTNRKFDKSHPTISSATWNRKLYLGGSKEYDRLNLAVSLNEEAALKSASWGMFQIMGFNYQACGFNDVFSFVAAMKDIRYQLATFAAFIQSNPSMAKALASHDWAKFAFLYNGPSYKVNQYDSKLAKAYETHLQIPAKNSGQSALFKVVVDAGTWMKYDDKVQVSTITDDNLKHFVASQTKIPASSWELNYATNHYRIQLDRDMAIKGRNEWFLYAPHYEIEFKQMPGMVNLAVPFLSQLDNVNRPHATCNITSVAMCLKFYGINGSGRGQLEDELYQVCQSKGLDIFTHMNLVKLFGYYGVNDQFSTTASWQRVKDHLSGGNPVIISGKFTKSGHIIVLRGFDDTGFFVNDPYGEYFAAGYRTNLPGENLHYSYKLMNRISYGGSSTTWAHFPEKI